MAEKPIVKVNPRYEAYATFSGMSCEDMAKSDEMAWPGGCMAGFILWMNKRHRDFWDHVGVPPFDKSGLETPRHVLAQLLISDYDRKFDEWLWNWVTTNRKYPI